MTNKWFRANVRFHSATDGLHNEKEPSFAPLPTFIRKNKLKESFLKGDPREFLG
jgi:hypothetical protein